MNSTLSNGFRAILLMSLMLISFISLASNFYWVGGSGNWSDIGHHWATASGGSTFQGQVPTSTDDVFFDANSFTAAGQIVTVDSTVIFFHDMDWTGAAFNPELSAQTTATQFKVFGSLKLIAAMNFNSKASVIFESNTTGNTIASAGHIFQNQIQLNGVGGGWTLLDGMTLNGAAAATNTGILTQNRGTFNTNEQSLTCVAFVSSNSNSRTLIIDNSLITLTASSINSNHVVAWNTAAVTNLSLSAVGSTIQITSTGRPTFNSGARTFNHVLFTNSNGTNTLISGTGTVFNGNVVFAGIGSVSGNNTFNGNLTFNKTGSLGGGTNICNGTTTFTGDGTITSSNTFNGILNFSGGKTYILTATETQTIGSAGTLVANGSCTAFINLESSVNGTQTTINKINGNLTISQVLLQDIEAIVASGFSADANTSIDAGNNTNWNFPPASGANMYWIGGSGNWDDPNHWSFTSGGSAGSCIPGPGNDVYFNSASGFTSSSKTVTLNIANTYCKSMNWTGASSSPVLTSTTSANLKIFGSLTLISAMSITGNGTFFFEARNTGNTITTAGKSLAKSIVFNGYGGEWTLMDGFTNSAGITLNFGTLNTNNQLVSCAGFTSSNGNQRVLNLGSTVLTVTGVGGLQWNVSGANLSFNAGTSTIRFLRANGVSMNNDALTFNNVSFESATSNATLSGNNTFNGNVSFAGNGNITGSNIFSGNLTFTAGKLYTLSSSQTQTIGSTGNFIANGNCSAYITIVTDSNGRQSTISRSTGNLLADNVIIQDIKAVVATGFSANATNKSTDAGNNTGWTFATNTGVNLYWIGNSGNWSDPNHWSLSSGGIPGACIPGPSDDVYFDANSFTSSGNSVMVNSSLAYCRNMDWTGSGFFPTLASSATSNQLSVYGSVTLISNMNLTFNGSLSFESRMANNTIRSAGQSWPASINFNGIGGQWTLLDGLSTSSTSTAAIQLSFGTLNTNNQEVTCFGFNSSNENVRTLILGSSVFTITGATASVLNGIWNVGTTTNFTFNAGTSTLLFTNSTTPFMTGGGKSYYHVLFDNINATAMIGGNNNFNGNITFNGYGKLFNNNTLNGNVTFSADGAMAGNNTFNAMLTFSPGKTYTLNSNSTQTIGSTGSLTAVGTPCFPIAVQSSTNGIFATLTKSTGEVCCDYLYLVDCRTSGAATFKAGIHSDNATPSTNGGWQFVACSTPLQSAVISSTGGNTACGTAVLKARTAKSYLWSTGASTQSIVVSASGTYSVFIINFNDCSESGSFTITINPIPSCTISGPSSVARGSQTSFTAPAGLNSYYWSVSGNAAISGSNSDRTVEIIASNSASGGSCTINLSVSNSSGCSSICSYDLTINPVPSISCPGNLTRFTSINTCNSTVNYTITVSGVPAPSLTYAFSGATSGNGNGDGSGSNFNKGVTTVCILATNSGGQDSCKFTINVLDTIQPVVNTQNKMAYLNASGEAFITEGNINNNSTDNCGIASYKLSKSAFDCSNIGNNMVTLTVTDEAGNTNSNTANVSVLDTIRPFAITKNITINLNTSGSASISGVDVNNGSSDACGILSMTVSPNSFNCSRIGQNTVVFTVTDLNGNSSTATAIVTVTGTVPSATITQSNQPGFCQGGFIILKTTANNVSSYLWSTGATTPTIQVRASGSYTVTVTNTSGCTYTASTTVNYSAANLLSSYTLLAKEEVELSGRSELKSGGAGAISANGEIEVEDRSKITATGTFAKAHEIETEGGGVITTKIFAPASFTLPEFKTNTYCNSNNNKTVSQNATVTFTDSVFGKINLGKGSTVIFTKPVLYIREFNVGENCTIKFNAACVEIRLCEEFNLNKGSFFNPDYRSVVIYSVEEMEIKKGCTLVGSVYCKEEIKIEGDEKDSVTMIGMFISNEEIEASNTVFYASTNCNACNANNKTGTFESTDEKGIIASDQLVFLAYPNPGNGLFTLDFITPEQGIIQVSIFDYTGKAIFESGNIESRGTVTLPVDIRSQASGCYVVKVDFNGTTYMKRMIIQKEN